MPGGLASNNAPYCQIPDHSIVSILMSDIEQNAAAFRAKLAEIADSEGLDAALDAAAFSLAHYSEYTSRGMMRQRGLILHVREKRSGDDGE